LKWFYNFNISKKLLLSFMVMAVVLCIVGGVGFYSLNEMRKAEVEISLVRLPSIESLIKMKEAQNAVDSAENALLNEEVKGNERTLLYDKISAQVIKAKEAKAIYEPLAQTVEEAKLWNTFGSIWDKWLKDDSDFVKLSQTYDSSRSDVIHSKMVEQALVTNTISLEATSKLLDKVIEINDTVAKEANSIANNTFSFGKQFIIIIILLGVLMAVALGVFISKIISKPIKLLVNYADRLALGDISIDIIVDTKDEIGILMLSFKKLIENIQDNVRVAENISKGDFSLKITEKSDKDVLARSMIQVVEAITNLEKESEILTKAAIDGKLDTRGNTEKFMGSYKNIIAGVNSTLDAVIEPVKEASIVLKEMSNGNLKVNMKGNYKGDHADIKNALNETIDSLSSYVAEISEVLQEMSNSNLELSINNEYKGDFSQIKDALNLIIQSYNEVFREINNAADQVSSGSNQVSDGSQALSQGTTEQASSIEELTSSITEVAAQTKQNAVNASQANELALNAKEGAVLGNSHMKEMLKSMEEINESSSNISKIIKVIDDIAFQTNILALNAAVEAARAGQHGKGFAVVAEEVRNLAARSANAAKETTDLIEGSIKKVEIGTKIANNTAESLDQIVAGVSKAATLVGEIAAASNEQATAIFQINKGIEQVSDVVQTNSATAEQSAAASEELSSQASMLKNMVGKFRLKRGSSLQQSEIPLGAKNNQKQARTGFSTSVGIPQTKSKPRISLSNSDFGKY